MNTFTNTPHLHENKISHLLGIIVTLFFFYHKTILCLLICPRTFFSSRVWQVYSEIVQSDLTIKLYIMGFIECNSTYHSIIQFKHEQLEVFGSRV